MNLPLHTIDSLMQGAEPNECDVPRSQSQSIQSPEASMGRNRITVFPKSRMKVRGSVESPK